MTSVGNVTMTLESYNELMDELRAYKAAIKNGIKVEKSSWSDAIEVNIDTDNPIIRASIEEQYAAVTKDFPSVERYSSLYLNTTIGRIQRVEEPTTDDMK